MEQLAKIIKTVFADFDEKRLREAMTLAEIPDWDSMNAVNLLIALESAYQVELTGTLLAGSTTIAELAGLLKQRGAAL
jgi:acyl carrier protein